MRETIETDFNLEGKSMPKLFYYYYCFYAKVMNGYALLELLVFRFNLLYSLVLQENISCIESQGRLILTVKQESSYCSKIIWDKIWDYMYWNSKCKGLKGMENDPSGLVPYASFCFGCLLLKLKTNLEHHFFCWSELWYLVKYEDDENLRVLAEPHHNWLPALYRFLRLIGVVD